MNRWINDVLLVDEWFIQDVADELERSYSHVRSLLRKVKPRRYIRQMPIYSTAQVEKLKKRNTKPGPGSKNGSKK